MGTRYPNDAQSLSQGFSEGFQCVCVYVYIFVCVCVCICTVWGVCTLHLRQLGQTNVRVGPYDSV